MSEPTTRGQPRYIRFGPGCEFATPVERIMWMDGWMRRFDACELPERVKGAAALLMLDLIAAAVKGQREGTMQLKLSVALTEEVSRALGLYGDASLELTLNQPAESVRAA